MNNITQNEAETNNGDQQQRYQQMQKQIEAQQHQELLMMNMLNSNKLNQQSGLNRALTNPYSSTTEELIAKVNQHQLQVQQQNRRPPIGGGQSNTSPPSSLTDDWIRNIVKAPSLQSQVRFVTFFHFR